MGRGPSRRLLLVLPFAADHGGLEQYAVDFARLAADHGWLVDVVAPEDLPESSWLRRSLAGSSTWTAASSILHAPEVRALLAVLRLRSRMLTRIRGVDHGDPAVGRLRRRLVIDWFWRTRGRRLARRAALVHVLGKPKPFIQQAIRTAAAVGTPSLYTEIAHVDAEYAARPDLAGFTAVAGLLGAVHAISHAQADALRRHFGVVGRIEVIDQWITPETERDLLACPPRSRREGEPEVVVGSLCRLAPEKGLPWLIDEFAAFRRATPHDVRLVVGGTGELEGELRDEVAAHGLEGAVELRGYQDDKAAFLSELDVFVVTSREEGGPISGLEALAADRPVVSTRGGAMPERLESLDGCALVDHGATGSLAAGLEQVVTRVLEGHTPQIREAYLARNASTVLGPRLAELWDELAGGSTSTAVAQSAVGSASAS